MSPFITEWADVDPEADDDLQFLAVSVRLMPAAHGAAYPSSAALIDGLYLGRSVSVPCDWRQAHDVQQAIADAQGEPIVCSAPRWALL